MLRQLGRRVAASSGRRLSTSSGLFCPSTYSSTRQPLAQARSLPGHVYNSKEWHEAEVRHLLEPSWILVGRADEFKEPGQFMKMDLPGGSSSIVVRGKDKKIRAWANVCTHRGAALTRADSGKLAGGISCPYHAWTYDPTSGALKGVSKKCATAGRFAGRPICPALKGPIPRSPRCRSR